MFKQERGKEAAPNRVPEGTYNMINEISTNNGVSKQGHSENIIKGNSITVSVNYAENVFYQKYDYCASVNILVLRAKWLTENIGLFISKIISKYNKKYDYAQKISKDRLNNAIIKLPIKDENLGDDLENIDFKFMEDFIAELEAQRIAELEAYLITTNLKDYNLTTDEKQALEDFKNLEWQEFNLEKLFGKSTRGKRLKSADRVDGNLPFVTAGEAETGISAYIGNIVEIFSKNTTTIDMFGSAKYRNYDYGADDHVAVVHTENLNKFASIFVATSINKASNTGLFSYSRNFYAKDADNLNINLPIKNGEINYKFMQNFIKAIEKLVIKDVVDFADEKISLTKKCIKTPCETK